MKPSFIIPILTELAQELCIRFEVEPRYGYVARIVMPDGSCRYMRNTVFDLNGSGATEIAKDKDYAAYFLALDGYPVPEGDSFHTREWTRVIGSKRSPEMAWKYAQKLGLPVIVKPNSKSQGSGVSLARNKQEFFRAVSRASKSERVFLVQRPVIGRDYRIVVIDGEVISAYERLPLTVVGDGRSTILELLKKKQALFIEQGRDTVLKPADPRMTEMLRKLKLTRASVLAKDEKIALLPNANLSTGGDARDVTGELHPEWKKLSATIARRMNLRYIGIDVMTEAELSTRPGDYTIIEVNAAPGLDNYASIGTKQMDVVKGLYRRVMLALIA